MDKDVLPYGYGFFWWRSGEDYIFETIEAAETAGMMAMGMGDESNINGGPLCIYAYFDGVRAIKCGWRVIITPYGSAQCAY